MTRPGDVGVSNNMRPILKGGALAALIRWFTGSPVSHSLLVTEPIAGVESAQEALMHVAVTPFARDYREDPTQEYWLYRPRFAPPERVREALARCHEEFTGARYGFLQLLWFVWRWLAEKLGRDVRHDRNWFSEGVICSELVYWYLRYLGSPEVDALLAPFSPDTIQAEDIRQILMSHPELFVLAEWKTRDMERATWQGG
jgi:hypothetical protein